MSQYLNFRHESVFSVLRQIETRNNEVQTIGDVTQFRFNKTLTWFQTKSLNAQNEMYKQGLKDRKRHSELKKLEKTEFEVQGLKNNQY